MAWVGAILYLLSLLLSLMLCPMPISFDLSEKKAYKISDSTKKCLAKCVPGDYDESEDFDFEEGSDKTEDTKKSTSSKDTSDDETVCTGKYRKKEAECRDSKKCEWNSSRSRCEDDMVALLEEAVTALA